MAELCCRYPSDLTEAEWAKVRRLIPPSPPIGDDRRTSMCEVVNAVFYVSRGGCSWRMLPKDFPPWQTVYGYFAKWKREGVWQQIHDTLRDEVRTEAGRNPQPSAGIVDSQSVKTTEKGGAHGYDAGKKINGRKRHLLVDTLGLLLVVVVHAANIQDRDGAQLLFEKAKGCFPRLQRIWADGGYAGKLIEWLHRLYGCVLEIVKRNDDLTGFHVLPRRWVVERTFGWLGRYRRLSKDYEYLLDTSETMIQIAMIQLMLRRLARTAAQAPS
jgi:putative transposase